MMVIPCVLAIALALLVWRDALPLLQRLVAVHERRHAVPAQGKALEPMPSDLHDLADGLEGEWARDETKAAMTESYHELGDWTLVRARYQGVV
jgi:hypothetical protein